MRNVAQDVRRRGLRRALTHAFTGLEAFYLSEEDRQQLAALPRFRRFFRRLWYFIVSLLMKLTPTRRVLLATGLVLTLLGRQRIAIGSLQLELSWSFAGGAVVLVVLMLELKDKLVARDELEAGRAVQLALMPGRSPVIPGWQVWLYTEPANDVGGDLVDHLQIDEHRHLVALGDVAGKALPAALLSVKLQATLRALAPRFEHLGDLGAALNRILHRDGLPARFASLAYLELRRDSGCVRILNAGHMPPLLIRGHSVTPMQCGSMVLGLVPDATFSEQVIDLNAGETMVIYSDGVSEAMNESDDFFGDDRLVTTLLACAGQAVDVVGARVLDALERFVGDAVQSDDVSLVVLKRV